MNTFGQGVGNESLNNLAQIESFYPDLAQNSVSNATEGEEDPQSGVSTRVLYWHHPDYVGNVDLVTDLNQEAYEFYLYNPWGESLYHWESGSSSWNSPFRFNSKEFDAETGMHYYGARYHHPKLSVWMSVDPWTYKTLESYQYTANNPIVLVDPDGKCPWCIPILILAFLTAPQPAMAPGLNETANQKALEEAQDMYAQWLMVPVFGTAAAVEAGTAGLATFLAEEALSYFTGLPFSPKDITDIARSLGRSVRIKAGTSNNTIVIGGGGDDVGEVVKKMNSPRVQTFTPSNAATEELAKLKKECNCGKLSIEELRETKMYKENKAWIKARIEAGDNIIDIGPKPNGDPSPFYEMELDIINSLTE